MVRRLWRRQRRLLGQLCTHFVANHRPPAPSPIPPRPQGWIPPAAGIQVVNSSATFWLAAGDRNNTPLVAPPPLPPNTFLTARVPIKVRDAYMPGSFAAYLYLGYRSAHQLGVNGVYLNEVPVDSTPSSIGNGVLVCVNDLSCSAQLPVYSGDAYVYDAADHAMLVEVGNKTRIYPGPANTTAQDSAFAVSLTALGGDGLPLDQGAWVRGCDGAGCWGAPPTTTVTCGGSYPVTLGPNAQTAVFWLDPATAATNVTFTTCPASGPASTVPVAISVFFGAFPVTYAYYHGSVGQTGDAYSQVTYMNASVSRPCGTVTVPVSPTINTWIVVGSPGAQRGTPATATLSVACGGAIAPSFYPAINLAGPCGSSSVFTMTGTFFSGQPVYTNGVRFVFYGGGCWNRWVQASTVTACANSFCTFGTSGVADIRQTTAGICPAGSYGVGTTCVACPAGRWAPAGSRSSTACVCPGEWTVDAVSGNCVGTSLGGPASQRTRRPVTAHQARSTIVPASIGCGPGTVPNSAGQCAACPAGCTSAGSPSSTCSCPWYDTVVMVGISSGAGTYTIFNATRNGLPVYRLSTGTRYMQWTGSSWAVVANVGDSGAYAFLSVPLRALPPQFVNSQSYAVCTGSGSMTVDSLGRRACYCPPGMGPDASGVCARHVPAWGRRCGHVPGVRRG